MADVAPWPAGIDSVISTFGAGLIGCFGMMALYGVTCVQSYVYFAFYPDDGTIMKSLVWAVWILDTLHVCLVCHAVFHYLVLNFGHSVALTQSIWSLWVSVCVNCIIGCIVQGFFAAKLYMLMDRRHRLWLMPLIVVLVACHLGFGIETAAFGLVTEDFAMLQKKIYISALPFAIFAVLSDFLIAGCLCVKLQKTKAYLMTANNVINQLIIFAVNRCLLTAGVAVLEIALFALFPNGLWYLALDFAIGKLYANSLLATLNTRYSIRARGHHSGKSFDAVSGTVPSFNVPPNERRDGVFSTVVPMTSLGEDSIDHVSVTSNLCTSYPRPKADPPSPILKRLDIDDNWQTQF